MMRASLATYPMIAPAVPSRFALAGLLAALSMFGPFCIDAIFPAFPAIAGEFGAPPLAMQQTISVYIGAYAVLSLLLGAMSDAWGRRTVILGGVGVFLAASVGCALARSMHMLLAFRALQGSSAGIGLIVGRAIVRDRFEGADAQRLLSQISMIFGVAPALAPIIGAWIVAFGGWRWLFWAIAGFAAALLLLCAIVLPETHARERRVALSPRNLFRGYRQILAHPHFLPLALASTCNFGGLFLYIAAAPAFVLGVLKLDPNQFYWLFVPAISGLVLGAMLAARLAGRVTVRVILGIGYSIIATAALLGIIMAWLVVPARVPWLVLPLGLAGVGINFVSPALNLLVLDLFPQQRGMASSLQAFIMLTFNALLAGAIAPMLADEAIHLALASAMVYALGLVAWRWFRGIVKRAPPAVLESELRDEPV
jgi:DHA1 family bicyclomycin/chloramphenicol resistance-like MFS transporter